MLKKSVKTCSNMSDNEEMMQTKNSSLEDSSGDESSSEAGVNNEFSSRDGEPVNKPRKVGQVFLFSFCFHKFFSVKTGRGLVLLRGESCTQNL